MFLYLKCNKESPRDHFRILNNKGDTFIFVIFC